MSRSNDSSSRACSATDYIPLLTTLSATNTNTNANTNTLLIAPDLPSNSTSHTPTSILPHPTVSACARLLNAFRQELSRPHLHPQNQTEHEIATILVGHSMGCRIALECFAQQPHGVIGVVLLDGSWYGPNPRDYKPTFNTTSSSSSSTSSSSSLPSSPSGEELRIVTEIFESMMGPDTPGWFRDEVRSHLEQVDFEYLNRLRRDYIRWDGERMEDVLGMVGRGAGVRVLVVQGTEGHGRERRTLKHGDEEEERGWMKFVRESVQGEWQREGEEETGKRKYTGLVVEGSGHWVHVDRVAEVAEAIARFTSEGGNKGTEERGDWGC